MTNPNNAVGTIGAYGGRTSVEALNDVLSAFDGRGIVNGFNAEPTTGLTVAIGGGSSRDVAIAEDNNGDKTTINNRSGAPINVTMASAHATLYRGDSIVVYTNNPPQVTETLSDNPSACGIIPVQGTTASSASGVTFPTNAQIRSAITADGGLGTSAYYTILANVTLSPNMSTLTSSAIQQGARAFLRGAVIPKTSATSIGGVKMEISSVDIGEGAMLESGKIYAVIQ